MFYSKKHFEVLRSTVLGGVFFFFNFLQSKKFRLKKKVRPNRPVGPRGKKKKIFVGRFSA